MEGDTKYAGCTLRVVNSGIAVYSPHGFRVGIRKTAEGAQRLATKTAQAFASGADAQKGE